MMAKLINLNFLTTYRPEFYLSILSYESSIHNDSSAPYTGFLVEFDRCIQDTECKLKNLKFIDEVAPGLVFWLSNKIDTRLERYGATSGAIGKFSKTSNHPLPNTLFYIGIHFLLIILITLISARIIGNIFGLLLGLSLCLFENLFILSYSNDVYLFPVYVMGICLLLLNLNMFKNYNILFLGILVGVLTWFRSSSWVVWISLWAITFVTNILSKNSNKDLKKILIFGFAAFFTMKIPNLIFQNPQHIFWHSLHAGLYEQGGIITVDGNFIPEHLTTNEDRLKAKLAIFRWSDSIQVDIARTVNKTVVPFSVEYEELIKKDFFRLIMLDPIKNILFYSKRALNVFDFYPLKEHDANGLVTEYPLSGWWTLFYFLLFLLFILDNAFQKNHKIFFTIMITASSLPSILVHSGYLTYNAPVLFAQWCLIAFFIAIKLSTFLKLGKQG